MADYLPGVFFFAKDRRGHTMFADCGILERYRMRDEFLVTKLPMLTGFLNESGPMKR